MPVCLPIQKLAATPMTPDRFKSALLRHVANPEWEQDVKYLRELYSQIASEWEQPKEQGAALYQSTEPKLRELLLILRSIADTDPTTQDVLHDFEMAEQHAAAGDHEAANLYVSYALGKIHQQIGSLSKMGSTKLGYGYDVSGEVQRGGGTSGEGRHLWDTGNSPKHDHTQSNPANMMFDAEAESDYPELRKLKHKRVHWPPRVR